MSMILKIAKSTLVVVGALGLATGAFNAAHAGPYDAYKGTRLVVNFSSPSPLQCSDESVA